MTLICLDVVVLIGSGLSSPLLSQFLIQFHISKQFGFEIHILECLLVEFLRAVHAEIGGGAGIVLEFGPVFGCGVGSG